VGETLARNTQSLQVGRSPTSSVGNVVRNHHMFKKSISENDKDFARVAANPPLAMVDTCPSRVPTSVVLICEQVPDAAQRSSSTAPR
jgi:hypothetical protein